MNVMDSNEAASPRLPHTLDTRNDIGGRDGIGPAEPSAPASDPASRRARASRAAAHHRHRHARLRRLGPSQRGQRRRAGARELLRDTEDESLRDGTIVPADLSIEVLDVLDFGRIKFDGDKTASMFTGATRPIYDLTWRYTLTGRLLWGGGTVWSRVMFPAFTEHVREVRPLAVVCTHITAANVAVGARMLLDDDFPIVCVPTDYETEGLWPHLHADLFCVANESMAETLRPRKVPEDRILITGIPTRPRVPASPTTNGSSGNRGGCRRTSASCWRWRAPTCPAPTCISERRSTVCCHTCTPSRACTSCSWPEATATMRATCAADARTWGCPTSPCSTTWRTWRRSWPQAT